jgi:predicted RNase H-like HicB family nuclease
VNRFEIIIFCSDEDQAYVADVPELPGCMSGANLP